MIQSETCLNILHRHALQALIKTQIRKMLFWNLFILGVDKTIHLWDIASGNMLAQLKGHTGTVYSLGFSREGSVLASGIKTRNIGNYMISLLQFYNLCQKKLILYPATLSGEVLYMIPSKGCVSFCLSVCLIPLLVFRWLLQKI